MHTVHAIMQSQNNPSGKGPLEVSSPSPAQSRTNFKPGSNCSAPFPLKFSKPATTEIAPNWDNQDQHADYLPPCFTAAAVNIF